METGPVVGEVTDPLILAVSMRRHVYQIHLTSGGRGGGGGGEHEEVI